MKVLVCGGRDFADKALLHRALCEVVPWSEPDEYGNTMPDNVTIIHGNARGADTMADDWAVVHWCSTAVFPAFWRRDGKAAGPIRNQRMLVEGQPDVVVAMPGGAGTADMIRRARKAGVPVKDYSAASSTTS